MFWYWSLPFGALVLILLIDWIQKIKRSIQSARIDRLHQKVINALTEEEHDRIDQALKLYYAGKIDDQEYHRRINREHRAAAARAGVRNWC